MNIPEYKPSPLTERLTKIVKERNKLETARIFDYVETQFPHLKEVYTSLETAKIKSDEMSCFAKTMRILLFQLSGKENFFNRRTNAGQIRKHLKEIFNCPYEFDCKISLIRSDASQYAFSDEQNIATTISKQKIVGIEELKIIRNLITDFLEMIGQLARRIQSCEMKRILRTIVAVKGKPWYSENLDSKDSERLSDDIIYCYEAVKSEIRLLSPAERATLVYPRIPNHRPAITLDVNPPSDLSPDEKTKYCREQAYKKFKEENFHLLPFIDFNCSELNAIKQTEEGVEIIAKSYNDNKLTLDKGEDRFNYEMLGQVLSADLRLYYDMYFMVQDFDEDIKQRIEYENRDDAIEDTTQQKSKIRIINLLRSILSAGIKFSAECRSVAADDWTMAQVTFEKRDGDFHSYSSDDDDAAAADLEEFLTRFRRGRQRLWADWNRHCRNDIKVTPIPTEPQGPIIEGMSTDLKKIAFNTMPKDDPRRMVVELIRDVNNDLFKGKSFPKAVKYIRFSKEIDEKYKDRVEKARSICEELARKKPKKKANNLNGVWNTCKKYASQDDNQSKKKRQKRRGGPTIPPIPQGW